MADDTAKMNDLQRLRRFLVLGNENGLYRVRCGGDGGFQPVAETAPTVSELLAADKGEEVVDEIVKFLSNSQTSSTNHTPALFALAMCARHNDQSKKTKQAAMKALATVCNSTADLFQFVSYSQCLVETKKGWGRALKTGIQRWFDSRDSMTLAKIITKQKTANSWNFKDLLRVTHIMPETLGAKLIVKYLVKGLKAAQEEFGGEKTGDEMQATLTYLAALEQLKGVKDVTLAVSLIEQHSLIPQQVTAQIQLMPEAMVALVKQLSLREVLEMVGRLSAKLVLDPSNPAADDVVQRITDEQQVKEEKLSPLAVLVAMRVYEQGSASMKWTRNGAVVDALNTAFATALKHNVVSTKKRYLVAVNINNQFMRCWVHGAKVLSPVIAAAGVALVLAHTEQDPALVFFGKDVKPLPLTKTMQMPEICEEIAQRAAELEGTKAPCDVSAPLTWAEKAQKSFDVIIIMTDHRHPKASTDVPKALKQYRQNMKIPDTKLIVCGMTSTSVQFADRDDPGMLDIAGFDATVPNIIHNFVMGSL